MKKAPTWIREWCEHLFKTAPEIQIGMAGFQARSVPRKVNHLPPTAVEAVEAGLPNLTARIGRRLAGEGLTAGFRVDLYQAETHTRSLAVAWRPEKQTLVVLRCAKHASSVSDTTNWIVELHVGDNDPYIGQSVLYEYLYSHLLEGGRGLEADQVGLVRNVVRSLHSLSLNLSPADHDPRRHPELFTRGQSPERWLEEVVKTTIARMLCAGLLGSERWAGESRTLVGWSAEMFAAFAHVWGWRGVAKTRETALERDLCDRFERWVKQRQGVEVDREHAVGDCLQEVDGQRPDIWVKKGGDEVVIEAKLGLTRDSIRTGLAQAREYAFHLNNSERPRPVLLLLGEEPKFHGPRFEAYVKDTALLLGIGVLVETGATEFKVWQPAHGTGLSHRSELLGLLCRG